MAPLAFASDTPRPGDLAIAVAHAPFFPLILSTGVVSATGRSVALADGEPQLTDALGIDATPDRREDGAPLLTGSGTVIGVIVDAGSAEPGVVALSGRAAAALVQQATASPNGNSPTFGLQSVLVEPATAALAQVPSGALVQSVTPDGPAAQAGLRAGDVVTAVDGAAIDAQHPLDAASLGLTVDQQVTLSVWRGGATLSVPLTVGAAAGISG
jgi:S1-C subfamily serine protease